MAVLGDALWASVFDRSPAAVGQIITVNRHRVTVIGVADRAFVGTDRLVPDAFWMPGVTEPVLRALEGRRPDDRATGGYYQFAARLAPGATWAQAEAELAASADWLLEQHPEENQKFSAVGFHNDGPIDLLGRERFLPISALMFGAGLLVLIIASSNVASLVAMRGIARRDEVAVRRALGAGRGRVLRQHVTEILLLWLLGSAAAMALVGLLVRSNAGARLERFGIPFPPAPFDWQVIAFGLALALVVGLIFAIAPAWRATSVEPASTLRASAATATRRLRAAPVLTSLQLAASLTLLVAALMLGVTLRNVMTVDLGFEPDSLTVFRAQAPPNASDTAAHGYLAEFAARLAARPGVTAVALADGAPFAGAGRAFSRIRRGPADDYIETVMHHVISRNYFSTLRVPLLRGRAFVDEEIPMADHSGRPAVVLSETLARQLFGTIDIVGRTIEQPVYQQPAQTFTIVGVAADVRMVSPTEPPQPVVYSTRGFGARRDATVIVRTALPAPLTEAIESTARALGTPPPPSIETMTGAIARQRGEHDLLAGLMALLGAIAVVVASVGVYGVVAFAAASRRAELGIRMALGASAAMVRREVLRGAVLMTAAGLVIGLAGAFGLMQVLRDRLVGVSPLDPVVWSGAALLLLACVALGALVPLRRATQVSLAKTLRAL